MGESWASTHFIENNFRSWASFRLKRQNTNLGRLSVLCVKMKQYTVPHHDINRFLDAINYKGQSNTAPFAWLLTFAAIF